MSDPWALFRVGHAFTRLSRKGLFLWLTWEGPRRDLGYAQLEAGLSFLFSSGPWFA